MRTVLVFAQDLLEVMQGRSAAPEPAQETIYYSSIADVLEALEIRKKRTPQDAWGEKGKEMVSAVRSLEEAGVLQIATLDQATLADGLFDTGSDHSECEIWERGARATSNPMHSLRLVALRVFDRYNDTELLEEAHTRYKKDQMNG